MSENRITRASDEPISIAKFRVGEVNENLKHKSQGDEASTGLL